MMWKKKKTTKALETVDIALDQCFIPSATDIFKCGKASDMF